MRRVLGGVFVAAACLPVFAQPAAADIRAGAATVDASWHVGASAGQYASDGSFVDPASGNYDPTAHSYRRRASYGIQSRLQARALVVRGPNGNRWAIVKNDLYIPQDLLWRRTALILEEGESGIGRSNLTMTSTHDHSSPFYSSTAWGAWAFQDVFDIRFYEYYAQQMAAAVEQAAADLRPVRVGASVTTFDKTHRHSFGPAIADDGTPAGYPHSDTDQDLTVVRFDDITDPQNPQPLANLVTYSGHPEFLNGNDLISADYVGPCRRWSTRRPAPQRSTCRTRSAPPSRSAAPTTRSTSGSSSPTASTPRPSTGRGSCRTRVIDAWQRVPTPAVSGDAPFLHRRAPWR